MFYCHAGKVTYLNVKGRGPNSAQLLATIGGKPFVVNAYPDTEPQVFSSICTVLSMAYEKSESVGISYELAEPTDRLFEVWLPEKLKVDEKRLPKRPK